MKRFIGEGVVEAGGQSYRLRFDMNVLGVIEELTGRNPVEVLSEMDGGKASIVTLRQLCHAMLMRHHPGASVETAGDLLSEDMEGVMAIVNAAISGADKGAAPAAAGRH